MSRYEWERGEFTLPSRTPKGKKGLAYASFKRRWRDIVAAYRAKSYDIGLELHRRLVEAGKGKRNVNWMSLWEDVRTKKVASFGGYREVNLDPDYVIADAIPFPSFPSIKLSLPWPKIR